MNVYDLDFEYKMNRRKVFIGEEKMKDYMTKKMRVIGLWAFSLVVAFIP